jgi:hypothetical protein
VAHSLLPVSSFWYCSIKVEKSEIRFVSSAKIKQADQKEGCCERQGNLKYILITTKQEKTISNAGL